MHGDASATSMSGFRRQPPRWWEIEAHGKVRGLDRLVHSPGVMGRRLAGCLIVVLSFAGACSRAPGGLGGDAASELVDHDRAPDGAAAAGGGDGNARDDADAHADAVGDVSAEADASPALCPPTSPDGGVREGCRLITVPAVTCSTSARPVDAAKVCPGGAASCPVTAALAVRCSGTTREQPWLVARGADGASILIDAMDRQPPTPRPALNLFTVAPNGASRVDELPTMNDFLVGGALSVDGAGVRSLFARDGTGLWRARETNDVWQREDVLRPPLNHAVALGVGSMADEVHGTAFFSEVEIINTTRFDSGSSFAYRDAGGWRFKALEDVATLGLASVGTDFEAAGTLWIGLHQRGNPSFVRLIASDGTKHDVTPSAGAVQGVAPVLLAGGLDGKSTRPAVAFAGGDALHVTLPAAGATGWTDRVLPSRLAAVTAGNCPVDGATTACAGASCALHTVVTVPVYGLARTTGGPAYAAWLENEIDQTNRLLAPPAPCFRDPQLGTCAYCQTEKILSWRSYTTLVVARLEPDPGAPIKTKRIWVEDSPTLPGTLKVTARGTTLLFLVGPNVGGAADLVYLEVDSTKLP